MKRPTIICMAFASVFGLAACETPRTQQVFAATADATMSEGQARSQCEFEVQAATEVFETRRPTRGESTEDILGAALADEIDREDEENRLFTTCMRGKGFVRV